MQIVKLVFWILFCQLPALAGSAAVSTGMQWYQSLQQPSFMPPDWLFGLAWGILYVLMGVAAFMLTKQGLLPQVRKPLVLFVAQLAVNALWTPVFFGQKEIGLALVVLSVLVLLNLWLLKLLWRPCRSAFWISVPYVLWLCFAWVLNFSILILN